MKKRLLALLMTMTMGLTACSGAADTSAAGDSASGSAAGTSTAGTSAPSTTSPQSAAAPEEDNIDLSAYKVTEPVTIQFWHQYTSEKRAAWIDKVTEEFNNSQDLVTVESSYFGSYDVIAEAVAASIAAGGEGLPAVVTINTPRVINYWQSGIVEPLDNYMAANEVDMDDYLASARDAYTMDDQLWGLPFGTSAGCIIYNKTVCDENDLPFPQTWDEFKSWCKNIYEKTGMTAFAFVNDFNYMNNFFINVTGKDPLGDGTVSLLNDPEFKAFVQDVKELCDAGYCVMWNTGDDQKAAFGAKTLAAYTYTTNDIVKAQQLAEENGFEISTQLGVTGTDKAPISTVSGASLVTFSMLDQNVKAAAAEYMAYLTNSDNNFEWVIDTQMLPSHYSVIQSDELQALYEKYPGYEPVFEQAADIISKNKSPMMQSCMEAVVGVVYAYVNGDITEADFDNQWKNMVTEVDNMLYDSAN